MVKVQFLGQRDRLRADRVRHLAEAGFDRHARNSTQISRRSSASGKARLIESWRRAILFFTNRLGAFMPSLFVKNKIARRQLSIKRAFRTRSTSC